MEVFPRPVRIAPARFLRPVAAAKALGQLRSDFSHLADEGVDLRAPLAEGPKAQSKNWRK